MDFEKDLILFLIMHRNHLCQKSCAVSSRILIDVIVYCRTSETNFVECFSIRSCIIGLNIIMKNEPLKLSRCSKCVMEVDCFDTLQMFLIKLQHNNITYNQSSVNFIGTKLCETPCLLLSKSLSKSTEHKFW